MTTPQEINAALDNIDLALRDARTMLKVAVRSDNGIVALGLKNIEKGIEALKVLQSHAPEHEVK